MLHFQTYTQALLSNICKRNPSRNSKIAISYVEFDMVRAEESENNQITHIQFSKKSFCFLIFIFSVLFLRRPFIVFLHIFSSSFCSSYLKETKKK